jgi:hypothetical protein
MKAAWNRIGVAVVLMAFALGALALATRNQPAYGGGEKAANGPRYTVVETEGHNLLVTDNGTNTFYFYTVDKGEPVGSELKLRGTVDLNQVGKATIMPKHTQPAP